MPLNARFRPKKIYPRQFQDTLYGCWWGRGEVSRTARTATSTMFSCEESDKTVASLWARVDVSSVVVLSC